MNIDHNEFKNKELIVRKTIVSFLEKLFTFLEYDISHERIKVVLYDDKGYETKSEEFIKDVYDAYVYLLRNSSNPFTSKLLTRFFFIYFGEAIDDNVTKRIVTNYFDYLNKPILESAVDFHIDVYKICDSFKEKDKIIISLILFNVFLIRNGIPTIKMSVVELKEYKKCLEDYLLNGKINLYNFFFQLFSTHKFLDCNYYKNLKDISLKDIYNVFNKDKELIKSKYQIKHLSVFGSFSKGTNRIDSDIDLLVSYSLDMTDAEKEEVSKEFKDYYFKKLNRFVDLNEISETLNDDFIKETTNVRKIF